MPEKVVKNYIKFVNKFKTKEISLISYDNFDKQTFDPNLLSKLFYNKLNVTWENTLIEDYKRKEIYLTFIFSANHYKFSNTSTVGQI